MSVGDVKKECYFLSDGTFQVLNVYGHSLSRPLCCHLFITSMYMKNKIKQNLLIYVQKQKYYDFNLLRIFF